MKLILKRQSHLEEQISKDFALLKQLEDEHRLTGDPQEKARLKRRINELNEEIESRASELSACQNAPAKAPSSEAAASQDVISAEALTVVAAAALEPQYALSLETKTSVAAPGKTIFESFLSPAAPPSPSLDFVGRHIILDQINSLEDDIRFVAVTGITGFGKTELLKQTASSFEQTSVFWHKFNAGFVSLQDVLARLARFLDTGFQSNFFEAALCIPEISVQDKIELIIGALNQKEKFLFFDDVHLIEANAELQGFFSLLKERLERGIVFVASPSQPDFINLRDVAQRTLRLINLKGLDENEIKEFLAKKGITISQRGIEKLDNYLDGMPLALELLITLAGENSGEERLIEIAENVRDRIIEHLYEALYEKLTVSEKNLLAVASLLKLPFTKNALIELNRAVFNNNAASQFASLRRSNLLVEADVKYYKVPEILAGLVLLHSELDAAQTQQLLAENLLSTLPDDYLANCEAFLLLGKAGAWNRAAEVASDLVNRYMVAYEPELAERVLDRIEENALDAERRIWLIGDKGLVASRLRQFDSAESFYSAMSDIADSLKNNRGRSLALQRLGALYVEKGDDLKAEEYYRECLKLKIESDDLDGQAEIHNNLGLIYSERKNYELAAAEFEAGINLRRQAEHPEWEYLPLYSNLGILYAKQKDWDKAFEYSRKALKIAENLKSPYDISKSLYNLALHQWEQGNVEEAREKLLEVLRISEEYDLDEVIELAGIALGRLHADIGEFGQAFPYFERVAKIFEKYGQKEPLCRVSFDAGTCRAFSQGPAAAVSYYLKGIELFEFLTDEKLIKLYLNQTAGLAKKLKEDAASLNALLDSLKKLKRELCQQDSYFKLASVYQTLGEIYLDCFCKERTALACFRQTIELFERLERPRETIEAAMHLGTICEEWELFAEALKANKKAAEAAEFYDFSSELGEILYNTANVYTKIELYSEAIEHYKKAETIAIKDKKDALLHSVRHNLGETYRREGNLDDAAEMLRTALSSAREKNNASDMAFCLNSLGLACGELGLETEALTHWHEAVDLCRKNEFYRKESNTLISIGNFYWRKEQYLQSKNYYEQAFQAALKAQDVEAEEAAMISLAEAHRRLGTFAEVEKQFIQLAERADEMGNYEHLIKFLAVAGAVNLEDGDSVEAAKNFEQALTLSCWRILDFLDSAISDEIQPFSYLELPFVLSRLEAAIEKAIEMGKTDSAKNMYGILKSGLASKPYWDDDNFINDILEKEMEILLPV